MDQSRDGGTLATSPSVQRHACIRCFKRKQKCDRLGPPCSNCREAGVECQQRTVSSPGQVANTDEDRVEIPVGEGYIGSLKRKISHLESLHQRKRRHVEETLPTPPAPSIERRDGQTDDPALGKALGDFHHLVLTSMAAEHSTIRNAASQLSLSGQVLKHASVSRSIGSADGDGVEHHYREHFLSATVSFSERTTRALFGTYISRIHWRHPYCEETSLREDYAYTVQRHDESESGTPVSDGPQRSIPVYFAVATAGFLSSSISSRVFASQVHLSAVNLFFQHSAKLHPLALVRCMTAMVICALYSSEAGQTWHLLGIAISTAISLGMHQRRAASGGVPLSQDGVESLFTVLYILDRVVSSSLKKPFAINTDDVANSQHLAAPTTESRSSHKDLLDHVQLLDFLHQKQKPTLSYIGAFMNWRCGPTSRRSNAQNTAAKELHLRHSCRAMMEILRHIRREPTFTRNPNSDRIADFTRSAVETSSAWLTCLSKAYEDDIVPAAMFDAYDIADCGIQCMAVFTDTADSDRNNRLHLSIIPSIVAECAALVGSLVGRFPAAKPLRKALLLCSQVMQQPVGVRQQGGWVEQVESLDGVPRLMLGVLSSILSA